MKQPFGKLFTALRNLECCSIYCSEEFVMLQYLLLWGICNVAQELLQLFALTWQLWRIYKRVQHCWRIIANGWNRCTSKILDCWWMTKYPKLLVHVASILKFSVCIIYVHSWCLENTKYNRIFLTSWDSTVGNRPSQCLNPLAKSTNLPNPIFTLL